MIGAGPLARTAGVFWSPRDDHAHRGRNLLEPLGRIFAVDVESAATARACLALRFDYHLLMRQVVEVAIAAGAALLSVLRLQRAVDYLGFRPVIRV